MANEYTITTPAGQTINREMEFFCVNTGTEETPVWSVVGSRVAESAAEYEWNEESSTDILGVSRTELTKPTITQTFEPCKLDSGDVALVKIWQLAIVEQNYAALAAMDCLKVHAYAGFGERYKACAVKPTSFGGAGGGSLDMPFSVTYGGERIIGTASAENGVITFTPEGESI